MVHDSMVAAILPIFVKTALIKRESAITAALRGTRPQFAKKGSDQLQLHLETATGAREAGNGKSTRQVRDLVTSDPDREISSEVDCFSLYTILRVKTETICDYFYSSSVDP